MNLYKKKQYLTQLIQQGLEQGKPLKCCTLVGSPKLEMVEKYKKGQLDCLDWMKEHYIPFEWRRNSATSVVFYFPSYVNLFVQDELYVYVKNPTLEQVNQIIESSFDEWLDVYEVDISPAYVNLFLDLYPEGGGPILSFEKLLNWLSSRGANQAAIANLVGRSPQLISDIKNGRAKPGIELIQVIMKAYPLLPWQEILTQMQL